jgi:fused signal recognition particle receptor
VTGALRKTQETLTSPLRSILAGRTLDDALIDEIEVLLLKADVGVQTTQVIITSMREDVRQ